MSCVNSETRDSHKLGIILNAPYDGVAECTEAVSKSSAVSVSGPEGTCPGAAKAMIPFAFRFRLRLGSFDDAAARGM